jgi:hypothetical protein
MANSNASNTFKQLEGILSKLQEKTEPFVNINNLQINEECIILTIIYVLLFVYKEDIMKCIF